MWDLDSRKTASAKLNGELNDVFLMPHNPNPTKSGLTRWKHGCMKFKNIRPKWASHATVQKQHAIFVLRWGFDWRKKAPIATRCAPTSYKCSYNTYRQLLNGFPWCFFSSPKEVVELFHPTLGQACSNQPWHEPMGFHGTRSTWWWCTSTEVKGDDSEGISGHRWWQEFVVDVHSCQRIPS